LMSLAHLHYTDRHISLQHYLDRIQQNAEGVNLIIDDIDFSTSRNSPIYTVMRGLIRSVIGLCIGAVVLSGVYIFLYKWSSARTWEDVVSGPYFDLLQKPIIVAIVFGLLGAVVSVLLRLSEFETATRRSRQFLLMTGIMLPIVGAVFASVTCALFASKIINFSFASESNQDALWKNSYFFIVIGFLSGFSERFTRGLLGTAENVVTRGADGSTVPGDLKPRSVNPPAHPRVNGNLQLTIMGENLNPVTVVRITNGEATITGTSVISNSNSVQSTIPIEGGTRLGTWNVVVADASERTAILPDALTIT
jgi:hypothetical protein